MKLKNLLGIGAGILGGGLLGENLFGSAASDLVADTGLQTAGATSMFDGIPSWLTNAGGQLLGAGINAIPGALGAVQQNQFNAAQAQKQMDFQSQQYQLARDFNASEADKTRQFQQNLADTSIQRRMNDLKAAGLNPMLAYSEGAATPSGATASIGAPSGAMASGQNIAASGMQYAASAAQVRNMDQQNRLIGAQVEKTNAETVQTLSSAGELDARKDNIRQEMTAFEKRMANLEAQTNRFDSETTRNMSDADYKEWLRLVKGPAEVDHIQQQANKLYHEATMLQLHIPEAVQEWAFWGSNQGRKATAIKYAPKNVTSAITAPLLDIGRAGDNSNQYSEGRIRQ